MTLQGQPEGTSSTTISPQTQHKQSSSWDATGNRRQPPPLCSQEPSSSSSAQRESSLTAAKASIAAIGESRVSTNGAVPGAGLQQPPGTDSPIQHPAPLCPPFPALLSWNSSQLVHKEKGNCPNCAETVQSLSLALLGQCVPRHCDILLWLFQLLHSSRPFQSVFSKQIPASCSLLQPVSTFRLALCRL